MVSQNENPIHTQGEVFDLFTVQREGLRNLSGDNRKTLREHLKHSAAGKGRRDFAEAGSVSLTEGKGRVHG